MNTLEHVSVKQLILFSFSSILLLYYPISPHPIHYPVIQTSQNFSFLAGLGNKYCGENKAKGEGGLEF